MKKKTGIIIGIVAILFVLIAVGVFTVLYFMTDIFKSSKQLFWEYASKSNQLAKMISSENESNQKAWKESHSYTAKGDLNIAVTKETGTKEIKLGTTEKHNQNTGRTYSDITLYNGEAELLKTSYINSGDIHALYCKDIYEPYYIGFRSSDLKEFISKMEITEDPMQTLELLSLENANSLTKEEITYLVDTYSRVLIDGIPQEKYTKTEKTTININSQNYEVVGYQLQLNQEDLKDILIGILTQTKADAQIISILSKMLASTENIDIVSSIEQVIEKLQEITLEEMNITITAYNVGKGLTRIQMNYNAEIEIILDIDDSKENRKSIVIETNNINSQNPELATDMQVSMEKQILDSMIIYTTNIKDNKGEYQITMNTSLGNISNNKIENNSKVTILDKDATIETSYYKTIQEATEEVDIQELTNSSAVIINNYPKEQLENFFMGIGNKIEEVIPEKIGQLNIHMTAPQDGLYYLEGIVSSTFAIMNTNGVSQGVSATGMTIASGLKQVLLLMNNNVENSIGNTSNSLIEQEKQIFNQKFEVYKGEGINGTLVKNLLSTIITSNTTNIVDNEKIVKVRLAGNKIKKPGDWNEQGENNTTKLSQLRENIKAGDQYNVVIEYNTKGFVEIITITEI